MNKTCAFSRATRSFARVLSFAGVLVSSPCALFAAEQPRITSVRVAEGQMTVTAQIPPGLKKSVLQSRTRVSGSSWIPRGVARLDNEIGAEITFNIPASEQIEFIRIQAETSEPLPDSFYLGTNRFNGEISSGPVDGVPPGRGPTDILTAGPGDSNEKSRSVVESDIWKVAGNRLYFYNQFRGMQIVDIANPGAPLPLGLYSLPAAGEQMYLVDSHAILLARNNCSYDGSASSQVVVVNVADGANPSLSASLPVDGYITESRMVGSALYLTSETYRTRTENGSTIWEWGTVVSSVDLSDPAAPMAKGAQWVSGYGNTVMATEKYLFVSTTSSVDYLRSELHCFDISSPTGEVIPLSVVAPAGRINDKFKINLANDVLTIISARWDNGRGWVTSLENYSFSNPAAPASLGQLQLGQGDQLHATRFDGDKAYIVTFYRVDPLWIVDLSDPARPKIAGELEVPGWSTYIYPWGDRLVTIGIDPSNGWRVAVSLFDVHDPAKPALIDKELLGQNYSWSEATYDEKAFNVLPKEGLIVLPFTGNVSSNGWAEQVQLLDLATNSLARRGTIPHEFQPRRATVSGEHILSISSRELLSVDASDRDNPLIKANLQLSWSVDRLFLAGDYVLEIENGSDWWWYNSDNPTTVRVASKSAPDRILNAFDLPGTLQVSGAEFRDGLLYIVQSRSFYEYPVVLGSDGKDQTLTNLPSVVLTVLDARHLPSLSVAGSHTEETTNSFWGNFDPIWVKTNVLVWAGGSGGYWWWWRNPVMDGPTGSIVSRPGYWGNSGNGRFFAFDVHDPAAPKFLNYISLGTSNRWNFSGALNEGPLVYVSDQSWQFVQTNETSGHWISRTFLNVIDYSDAELPAVRKPVNVPGSLRGLSDNGRIIYTGGPHWTDENRTDWNDWIDASAYDDVEVHLLDSLYAGPVWTSPYITRNGVVYTTKSGAGGESGSIKMWKLSSAGKFAQVTEAPLPSDASMLAIVNDLLLVRDNYSGLTLFNAASESSLNQLAHFSEPGCLYFDLEFAQGSQADGLWLPLREFGIWHPAH